MLYTLGVTYRPPSCALPHPNGSSIAPLDASAYIPFWPFGTRAMLANNAVPFRSRAYVLRSFLDGDPGPRPPDPSLRTRASGGDVMSGVAVMRTEHRL